ncbi:MAG: acetoacetate decarboxylase family protein [Aggregatilineales bacterium]
MIHSATQIAAPPWELRGDGFILIYRFPEAFIRRDGNVPRFLSDKFAGGWGTVMLMDYHTSPVGAYRELLFVPGVFDVGRRWTYSVTKIYVSTMASVVNGRENWGIPKQLADFELKQCPDNRQHISVSVDGNPFFSASLRVSAPRLPVTTRLLPFRPALIQQSTDQPEATILLTKPTGSGWVRTAKIETLTVDNTYFPNIEPFKPIVTINVANFTANFPIPKVMVY